MSTQALNRQINSFQRFVIHFRIYKSIFVYTYNTYNGNFDSSKNENLTISQFTSFIIYLVLFHLPLFADTYTGW